MRNVALVPRDEVIQLDAALVVGYVFEQFAKGVLVDVEPSAAAVHRLGQVRDFAVGFHLTCMLGDFHKLGVFESERHQSGLDVVADLSIGEPIGPIWSSAVPLGLVKLGGFAPLEFRRGADITVAILVVFHFGAVEESALSIAHPNVFGGEGGVNVGVHNNFCV